MSGLAAGIRLAQFDCPVTLLERHSLWGGLNSFYKLRGRKYDVGLHALTNYVPRGTRGAPLTKALRQLRLRHADLELGEQSFSEIAFPDLALRFSNDFEELRAGVHAAFPECGDAFDRLTEEVRAYDLETVPDALDSTRARLERDLRDPRLVDCLMLPLCYYGSAREDDLDWYQFCVLFQSIFLEGFARPKDGIRNLLKVLVERFKSLGGELRMRTGVSRILTENGRTTGVELDDGSVLRTERVLSSAGYTESMELCGRPVTREEAGGRRLTFFESIFSLDRKAAELGHEATIVFFNTTDRFEYRSPATDIDPRSGVIATPDNYANSPTDGEGCLRVTALASWDRWTSKPEEEYVAAKAAANEALLPAVTSIAGDFREHVLDTDSFTPRTIHHYTGHLGGSVYGCTEKRLDGRTPVDGLYVIGTDQGYLGVVGALVSGIGMANQHVLAAGPLATGTQV